MNRLISLLSVIVFLAQTTQAQIGIGQWRDHLPYNNVTAVAETPNKVYAAATHAVFALNKEDNSIERLTKVTGLSDVGVSTLRYHEATENVVIAYNNGNIDLINGNIITNVEDVKRSSIIGDKKIYAITLIGDFAYLSCGFGIVVLDLFNTEIKDTYLIGPQGDYIVVNDITFDGTYLFAATENGIYQANINDPNLVDFAAWTKHNNTNQGMYFADSTFSKLAFFNNQVLAVMNSKVYSNDSLMKYDGTSWSGVDIANSQDVNAMEVTGNKLAMCYNWSFQIINSNWEADLTAYTYGENSPQPRDAFLNENGVVWVADKARGLVKTTGAFGHTFYLPEGPATNNVTDLAASGEALWVAPGGISSIYSNIYNSDGMFGFDYSNGDWESISKNTQPTLEDFFDFVSVTVNPDDAGNVFFSSLGGGLVELQDGEIVTFYDSSNSTIPTNPAFSNGWYGTVGSAFDDLGNLWVAVTSTTQAISVKKADGKWLGFSFPTLLNSQSRIGEIFVSQQGQKWVILPKSGGILVFDDNQTIDNPTDDRSILLNSTSGQGGLPSSNVFCAAEDKDGEIWVGTDKGIAVFYSPGNIFTGNDFDAQQVFIQQDGQTQLLFETELVSAIAIDGANRKWVGTESSGVFLMNEDGTEEVLHFTAENSPLFSNTIRSIAIDDKSGEVFIGTDKGLLSYKSDATEGAQTFNDVKVYPNPVRETYSGPIAIEGLVTDASVKITDVAGNLVFETIALGGQAIWNGKNLNGERAATGVYLVFSTSTDGAQRNVAKILFIN